MQTGKIYPLIMLLVYTSLVYSDSHSLRYYVTGVSAPGSGLTEYSEVGYMDDQEIVNYNTESGKYRPRVKWMEKMEAEYWWRETQIARQAETVNRHNMRTLMSRFNQTEGFHILQRMYGCELRDDGSITGYEELGYDGGEFIFLDTQTGTFIPTMRQAQISTERLNSPNVKEGEKQKEYLENTCIYWLKKYVEYGREDLERREPKPEKLSDLVTTVIIAMGVVVLLLNGIVVFLLYRKKNVIYKKTSTSDASSDSSHKAAKA